ncbi:MAG: OsmC family protein [Bacteroidetes bacterium]|nr:OsmC family protein [Bacteroidota bacterium]MDA0888801.1 OsmC family protein [Bacteroidota bacterium]MDA1084563.1 OsmC family protein [Bacteroidota bacterium]
MNVRLTHKSGYHAIIENDKGHQVAIDNKSVENPQGASPMELLLMGVAGCSSIDIISILNKQKVAFDSLEIDVDGERVDKPAPSLFTKIHATVRLTGNVKPEKIFRAAELSFTKYCSVSLTLAATADIRFSVIVNDIPYVKA